MSKKELMSTLSFWVTAIEFSVRTSRLWPPFIFTVKYVVFWSLQDR